MDKELICKKLLKIQSSVKVIRKTIDELNVGHAKRLIMILDSEIETLRESIDSDQLELWENGEQNGNRNK